MDGWTNGRMDGQMDEWTNGRMDEWTNGRTDERTNGRTDERTNGRTDGRTNGRTDGRHLVYRDEKTRLKMTKTVVLNRKFHRITLFSVLTRKMCFSLKFHRDASSTTLLSYFDESIHPTEQSIFPSFTN